MTSATFDGNESGYEYRYETNHDPSSALYIKDVRDVKISLVNFKNHKKTNYIDLVPFARGITYGLPSNYLESSHSPVIRMKQQDQTGFSTSATHLVYRTEFNQVSFTDNYNYQLLGLGEHAYYHGSLLSYEAQTSNNPIDAQIKFAGINAI